MIADDSDDRVAYFSFAFLVLARLRVGFVWHSQVGTQDVDADLPLFCPVVGESGQGVHASKADGGRVVAELAGGGGVAVGEMGGVGAVGVTLGDALFAVGVDTRKDEPGQGEDGDGDLDAVRNADSVVLMSYGAGGDPVDNCEGAAGRNEGGRCYEPDG